MTKRKKGKPKGLIALTLVLAVSLVVVTFFKFGGKKEEKVEKLEVFLPHLPFQIENASVARIYLPAVNAEGEGVMTTLVVEAVPGSGRTLVDIENLLFWADTQHSIRKARLVAQNLSGINVSNYDLIYNIYANASVIGGESAGAAITIATIAALENKSLKDDVVITGTVNHDGTIGPVKAILPKARAAKAINATLFLVPLLQSKDVIYETHQHCEKFGPAEVCTTETIPKKVEVSEEAGIEIREVGTIQEALEYFLK